MINWQFWSALILSNLIPEWFFFLSFPNGLISLQSRTWKDKRKLWSKNARNFYSTFFICISETAKNVFMLFFRNESAGFSTALFYFFYSAFFFTRLMHVFCLPVHAAKLAAPCQWRNRHLGVRWPLISSSIMSFRLLFASPSPKCWKNFLCFCWLNLQAPIFMFALAALQIELNKSSLNCTNTKNARLAFT